MVAQEFRIGIVGIGGIAESHAKAIADIPNAHLVGGCCRTEAKGQQFAKKFACEWFSDYESMFEGLELDVVTICTPSGAHLEPTLAATQRGIHVLCEKPLEINMDRAGQMMTAAEEAGVLLGGIFPQRFNPVVKEVHQAASQGRFGKLAFASAYVPWWRDDEYYAPTRWQGTQALDGGGAIINQSIHAIDAMAWIAKAAGAGRVTDVFGYTSLCSHDPSLVEVEDLAVAGVRFESGALGNIVASTAMWPGTAQRIHFAGRDGTAEVHEDQLVTWRFRDELESDQQLRRRFGKTSEVGGAADPLAIGYSNHTRNIEDFLAAIAGERPLQVTAAAACESLAVIRAIYESAQTGAAIKL